ncbi:MAG: electron transfer flavoprotein subunit alpha [Myxococcales bacterium]
MARRKGTHFDILVVGSRVADAAAQAARYGARKVLVEDSPAFSHYLAQSFAHSIAAAAKATGASFVAATATTFAKDVLPAVAVKLGAGMASDVLAIAGEGANLVFKRPMWAGNVIAHVTIDTPVAVVSVRGTDFDAAKEAAGASPIEAFDSGFAAGALKQKFVGFDATVSERPDLTEAKVVVAGGRGLKDKESFFKVMEPLADALGAAIGASRAAVDAGFCPNDFQIGQTGKAVAPGLYFAIAISGAIQHIAGMKNSKVIVAINKDPEAPIYQLADYGLAADAFKVVPELVEKLKALR